MGENWTPGARSWRRYLRFWGSNVHADVRDELQFHIEMRAREYESKGMSRDAAEREARARFGNVAAVQQTLESHDGRRQRVVERRQVLSTIGLDLRYAVRTLRRSPGFLLAAVLCFGLGTGATAAVFAVVEDLLLRPLPVAHPENLAVVATLSSGSPYPGDNSYLNAVDIRALTNVFSDATAHQAIEVSLRVGERTELRLLRGVAENYWSMLGVPMALGRPLLPDEVTTAARSIVISYRVWQEDFSSAPDVLGRSVGVDGLPMTIVGVAPASFHGTQPETADDGWIPVTLLHDLDPSGSTLLTRRSGGGFKILARLRPGIAVPAAQKALDLLATQLQHQYPAENEGKRFLVAEELHARPDIAVSDLVPRLSTVFMGLTALVLLIACANVASLLLARASERQTELAVRTALGARRGRLIAQLLTESLILAALGSVVGLALATGATHWVRSLRLDANIPLEFQVLIDWRVLAITLAVAVGAAVVSGVGPALRSSDPRLGDVLKASGRGGGAGSVGQRFRTGLVVAQVAVSFVVLAAAGLFLRSVEHAASLDLGFRQDHIALATVDVTLGRYDPARGTQYFRSLLREGGELPGVRKAALASVMPLGTSHSAVDVYADLPSLTDERGHTHIEVVGISPDYFDVMGIRMLSGRDFTMRDDSSAPRVMIINATTAARLWPGEDAVGRRVRFKPGGPEVQVVGVVGTVTSTFVGEAPRAMLYVPFGQRYESMMTLHLATESDPQLVVGPVRTLIQSLDPTLVPYSVGTMHGHLHDGIAFTPIRFAATVAVAVGLVGLVLALVGLYGVIAYSVSRRSREIGIRMAMGATAGAILRSIIKQGMMLTALGVVTGLVLSLTVTGVLKSLLIGVGAHDPLTFIILTVLLATVTLAACWIPAWRAARVPPVTAIRA